jgi:hypothetical protein
VVQHPINSGRNHLVNHKKIHAEENDRDDHHCRSGLNFSPAGKRNFPHLIADVSKKFFRARRKLRYSIAVIFARHCYCLRHWFLPCPNLFGRFPNLAGAEGFEPPSPVLETGSLAVELTPLFLQGLRNASLLRPHALLALFGARFAFHPAYSSIDLLNADG